MAVTKSYVDNVASGVTLHGTKPAAPVAGDMYFDILNMQSVVYTGTKWTAIAGNKHVDLNPTHAELEKYPALKSVWEEYIAVRKLVGLPC